MPSTSVKIYFNNHKNRSFYNEKLPILSDKFICKHIKEIEGIHYKENKPITSTLQEDQVVLQEDQV